MDASYKIQRGIHVHLIEFFMCPEFWVHIRAVMPSKRRLFFIWNVTKNIFDPARKNVAKVIQRCG